MAQPFSILCRRAVLSLAGPLSSLAGPLASAGNFGSLAAAVASASGASTSAPSSPVHHLQPAPLLPEQQRLLSWPACVRGISGITAPSPTQLGQIVKLPELMQHTSNEIADIWDQVCMRVALHAPVEMHPLRMVPLISYAMCLRFPATGNRCMRHESPPAVHSAWPRAAGGPNPNPNPTPRPGLGLLSATAAARSSCCSSLILQPTYDCCAVLLAETCTCLLTPPLPPPPPHGPAPAPPTPMAPLPPSPRSTTPTPRASASAWL